MAEIEMERRRKSGATKWIVLLLVLVAVAVAAWVLFGASGDAGAGVEPAAETTIVPEPVTEPATPLQERPADDEGLAPEGDAPDPDPAPSDTLTGNGVGTAAPAPSQGRAPRRAA